MDPNQLSPPSIPDAMMSAPSQGAPKDDPLVKTWFDRVKAGRKRWKKMHERMRHNRMLVRGIDDQVDAKDPKYNIQRANLIASTLTVVLSKVYAKNPEMSAEPRNKALDLRLFADTVSQVTQAMLEDANLKKKAKATVRASMTCSLGVVKVQYQREMREDPIIKDRIQDAQDNVARIESLLKDLDDPQHRCDEETKKRQLEESIKGLQAQKEVVAAEGLVVDRTPSDRLIVDPTVEDIWEYETAGWMAEEIPMRKSIAQGLFGEFDLDTATTFKVDDIGKDPDSRMIYNPTTDSGDDPIIMVVEVWSKQDQRIYTMVEGCQKQFAREPYTPQYTGERWWPYFILPFQTVDGVFQAQSLVDALERLQEEHNETRDKFAEVRRTVRPSFTASGDLKDKDIKIMTHPEIGEIVVVNTNGAPIDSLFKQSTQLQIDPAVFDTSPISHDWEQVAGLQDAARSIVVEPKTATEAAISDQSLAARVAEFRDQIEDFLTEVSQYSSELCLLALTPEQVETIMGTNPTPQEMAEAQMTGQPMPRPVYYWPQERTPETVFNLIQMKIRAGSTVAPNKLQVQENWNKALQILGPMIDKIRAIEASGGDATSEREMVKETAARFDETIDVDRFLPPKQAMQPPMPGMPAPGGMPAGPMPPARPPMLPAGGPQAGGPPLQ